MSGMITLSSVFLRFFKDAIPDVYTDIREQIRKIVGETKYPLSRCIPFNSKVKNGDIVSTGHYLNQSFTNLQIEKFLKTHSIS